MSKEAVYSMATAHYQGRTVRIPVKTGEMDIPETGATTTSMRSLAPMSKEAYAVWKGLKATVKEPHVHQGYTKRKLTREQIKARRKKGRR